MTPGVVYLQQGMLAVGLGSQGSNTAILWIVTAIIWVLGVVVALGLLFLLFMVATCLLEKQRLVGEQEPTRPPYPYKPTRYWEITRGNAFPYGLEHAGDFATKKGAKSMKGLESLFITADRMVVVSIRTTEIVGAKQNKTVLRTRLSDGRVLESSDQSGVQDPSGHIDRELLMNAGLEELLALQERRIRTSGLQARAVGSDVYAEMEKIDLERGQRWIQQRYAYWVNPEQTILRMTLKGAMAQVRALYRELGKVSAQKERSGVRRAG